MRTEPRWVCILLATLLVACSTRDVNLATSARSLDAGEWPDDDAEVDFDPDGGPVFSFDAGVAYCGDERCACSNGEDDDLDGKFDLDDPECTSPADQFEEHFGTGAFGENSASKCQDCYFDNGPWTGNDPCSRPRSCATNNNASGGNGACRSCDIDESSECVNSCEPLVPNGCDCFGCCGVYWRDGTVRNVLLSSSCSWDIDILDDPARCEPCIPSPTCRNTCQKCELCPGRTVADLPAECQASGPGLMCNDTEACQSASDCANSEYCLLGCCLPFGI